MAEVTYGSRVAERRSDLGWTRHYLAQLSGVPYMSIKRIEDGDTAGTFTNVVRLARALDIPIQILAAKVSA